MASAPSQACLCTPSVPAEGYDAKGTFQEINGLKLYFTGPTASNSAIVFIYDAYGYADQVLAGADLLSDLSGSLVIVPDVLGDAAISPKYRSFDQISEEIKKPLLATFMGKINEFRDFPGQILDGLEKWGDLWPSVEKWGVFGLCFGGKLAVLLSQKATPFLVSGQAHPSFLANGDPDLVTIPHICLASKDENPERIAEYKTVMGEQGHVNTYPKDIHGWMGAKADLTDPDQKISFHSGYQEVSAFFRAYLSSPVH
ncbi:hypothetical protein TWF481_003638 [Arthrobotrys musiformis]|uniref:Dienelactone hydrolase domain-containing protein n=1 Tax=Arthrobotrys musiformis TaxID=47236 RepID=A0AAV9WH69_9PEZI